MFARKIPKKVRFDRYFLMFDACALLFLVLTALEFAGYDDGFLEVIQIVWAVLVLALFSRKRRDEFAEHCWQRATSATFVMLVVAPLALAFVGGIIDGATGVNRAGTKHDIAQILTILFATFYGVFEWTRFRGGR